MISSAAIGPIYDNPDMAASVNQQEVTSFLWVKTTTNTSKYYGFDSFCAVLWY